MDVILHKNDDGSNAITYVAKGHDAKKTQEKLGGIAISSEVEDLKFSFFNAYTITNNTLGFDLEKAREIKLEDIRQQRDEEFLEFDKRYTVAMRDGLDLTELNAEREVLKNVPEKAAEYLNSCINIEEIENLTLLKLL